MAAQSSYSAPHSSDLHSSGRQPSGPTAPDGYLGAYPIGRPVVLTPGYQDDARKLTWLASFFRRSGLQTFVISPQPTDASVGIDVLAEKLAAEVERELGPDQPFDFLGFSMGGLIGRYYLQRLGGEGRVQRFATVATPHRGTLTARLLPHRPALVQMYPHSDFLTDLNRDLAPLAQRDFMAFWTPFDLSVTPAYHAYLPELPATRLYSPFHATLLHDPVVMREVVNFFLITAADKAAAAR